MKLLRSGQETVLSWRAGAVECRVIAAAGRFVLLRPAGADASGEVPEGECSLTYLDGMVPMGWDGSVEAGAHSGELRFRVGNDDLAADRRSSVRVPLFASVTVTAADGSSFVGQLLDVSAGGLRFRMQGTLAAGARLRVRSAVQQDLVVEADAVVRMAERGVASVEFTAMYGADAQAIGAWTVSILRASLTGRG